MSMHELQGVMLQQALARRCTAVEGTRYDWSRWPQQARRGRPLCWTFRRRVK
jgi:hypothetical protein